MDAATAGFPLTAAVSTRAEYVTHTGSTNADLLEGIAERPHGEVLITGDQRAGRGRLDRTWVAPAGATIAVSVVFDISAVPPAARGWVPLAAGVAMTEAIARQLPGRHVAAKWPNDVLVDGAKICGILAEAALGASKVVVGAGVNTAMSADELPVATATSFALQGVACDADVLIRDFVVRCDHALQRLSRAGGDATVAGLRGDAISLSGTIGAAVRVHLPDGSQLVGVAVDIGADGTLVVQTDDGRVAVGAGDVVHVRPA